MTTDFQEEIKNAIIECEDCLYYLRVIESKFEEEKYALDILKEILDSAENEDYGLKTWRTLTTKQDLINAIKNEVLNG